MGTLRRFEFVIKDAFTPATLPMSRLAEYMADLAVVVGEKEHVHFVELREGSAALAYSVDHEAAPKAEARLRAVRANDDEAEPEAVNAFRRIDKRLRDDNAHAVLRERDDESSRLLVFPGATATEEERYGPCSQPAQLYGVPIMVGGKGRLANVNLEDGDRVYYCEAERATAQEIGALLYRDRIRVSGTGRFERDRDGAWLLRSFRISSFEVLDNHSLPETVSRLREVTRRVGLDDDILAKLSSVRDGQ